MGTLLVLLAQSGTPGDCLLTGLCNVVPEQAPAVPSGVLYIAAGLVVGGVMGWRRVRRDALTVPEPLPPRD